MTEEARRTDTEEVKQVVQHNDHHQIDDSDLKGELDIGAQALVGQDLVYTKEGNFLYLTCFELRPVT